MSPTLGSLPVNMIVKRFHDVNIFYGKWPSIPHGCLNHLPNNPYKQATAVISQKDCRAKMSPIKTDDRHTIPKPQTKQNNLFTSSHPLISQQKSTVYCQNIGFHQSIGSFTCEHLFRTLLRKALQVLQTRGTTAPTILPNMVESLFVSER